ncbi:MAG: hypothetical protein J6X84_02000 [Treponema sp.]|nr:hypothetical protein [Treponema sp.]
MNANNQIVSTVIKDYKESQRAFLPKIVSIPLAQEDGKTFFSLVEKGDVVKEGEIIAQSESSSGKKSFIHSSVPGTVVAVEPCFTPEGKQDFSIKIKFGGSFSYLGKKSEEKPLALFSSSEIIEKLSKHGVINSFNTASPQNLGNQIETLVSGKKKPEHLIVRLFDEDPYRVTDFLLSKLYIQNVLEGAKIVAKAINAKKIILAVDQKVMEDEVFSKTDFSDFQLLEMNIRRYPCGTPREIISAFARASQKKEIGFTLNKYDLFIDSTTALSAFKAVSLNIPCVDGFVHFFGNCLYASCLLEVRVGTTLRDIVNQIGGFIKEPAHIIINGRLCGICVQSLDIPITKYVKSVEFISKKRITDDQVYSCVNCGNCRFVCPVKLSPDILYNNTVNFKLLDKAFAASAIACLECGLCNTVCPARLPLSQTIKVLKNNLKGE